MADNVAIRVSAVSKSFKLPHEKHSSIKSLFVNIFRGRRTYEKQQVLKDVSLDIKRGEFFGIIGRNGSGKSTLLKMVSGIYAPNRGAIKINGKLTPFIELGVGFNPELTGRENVFLNGALLGKSRKEMEAVYDEIVQFAELERFMDQKLKNYSSGMQVRLAFSVAIQAHSDILVLDEVLAVGDSNFRKKCIEVFRSLKKQGKTIVLVSHDTMQIERFCDRVAVIDKGKIIKVGHPTEAIEIYDEINKGETVHETNRRKLKVTKSKETQPLTDFRSFSIEAAAKDKEIVVKLPFNLKKSLPDDTVVAITLEDEEHTIYAYSTDQDNIQLSLKQTGKKLMTFNIANVFPEGRYYVDFAIVSRDRAVTFLRVENAVNVICEGLSGKEWLIRASTKLEIE